MYNNSFNWYKKLQKYNVWNKSQPIKSHLSSFNTLAWKWLLVNISLCKHIHGTLIYSSGPFHIIFNYCNICINKNEKAFRLIKIAHIT